LRERGKERTKKRRRQSLGLEGVRLDKKEVGRRIDASVGRGAGLRGSVQGGGKKIEGSNQAVNKGGKKKDPSCQSDGRNTASNAIRAEKS